MKITITHPTTGQSYPICQGGKNSPLDDMNWAHTSLVQEAQFVRAKEVKHFDRGNASFDKTFPVLYERSGYSSAEGWIFEMGRRIPRFGRVQFITEPGPGGSQTWYLHNASCQIVGAKQIGSSIIATFRIRGGIPTGIA